MKLKEFIAKLEVDLQKYPYEVNLCFSCSDATFANILEKKFTDVFVAEEYAKACWKRNPLTFKYIEVIRRHDQMSMLYFDAVNPNGYSEYGNMLAIEDFKHNYEIWYNRKCMMSDKLILECIERELCPWDSCAEDVSELMGIYE